MRGNKRPHLVSRLDGCVVYGLCGECNFSPMLRHNLQYSQENIFLNSVILNPVCSLRKRVEEEIERRRSHVIEIHDQCTVLSNVWVLEQHGVN